MLCREPIVSSVIIRTYNASNFLTDTVAKDKLCVESQ